MKKILNVTLSLSLLMGLIVFTTSVSAQGPIEVMDAQNCTDGFILEAERPMTSDEILFVGWLHTSGMYGFAGNQVALTGLTGDTHRVVIPHLNIPVGEDANYVAFVVTDDSFALASLLLGGSLATGQIPEPEDLELILGRTPFVSEISSVEDCTIRGEIPTISNVAPEDFGVLLTGGMLLIQDLLADFFAALGQ